MTDSAYPVPVLNIFNEEHYKDALENASTYANMVINKNAVDAKQTVFMGSGHLNFTDLPIFSPMLANALGTGEINSRYCIETCNSIASNRVNDLILQLYDGNFKERNDRINGFFNICCIRSSAFN